MAESYPNMILWGGKNADMGTYLEVGMPTARYINPLTLSNGDRIDHNIGTVDYLQYQLKNRVLDAYLVVVNTNKNETIIQMFDSADQVTYELDKITNKPEPEQSEQPRLTKPISNSLINRLLRAVAKRILERVGEGD